MGSGIYKNCPCKGCEAPKRHPGCHSICEDKRAWDESVQAKKQEIWDGKAQDRQVVGFKVYSVRRALRRANKKSEGRNL